MLRDCHYQPQQQAGQAPRLRTRQSGTTLRRRHALGMQPAPHMAQHQRYAHQQQTQSHNDCATWSASKAKREV